MPIDPERARRYRTRAHQLRTTAALDRHARVRDTLITIAESYERLAEGLDASAEIHAMPSKDSMKKLFGR